MDKKELWLKLKAYHFDHVVPAHLWDHITSVFGGADASTKAFASKIVRKSGWTPGFALRAIAEYKKFVYLGVVSDFNVTPSKIIDQVWHEHLLFSKAYRQFCKEVIDYTFDHNPELVAMTDQTGTFSAQYLDTISMYKTEFGIDPPPDIWNISKFDQKKVVPDSYKPNRKKKKNSLANNTGYADGSLISFFIGSAESAYSPQSFPEFGGFGGGEFSGAGAGGSWSDHGSDGGGSACSSSCGGGGGGD